MTASTTLNRCADFAGFLTVTTGAVTMIVGVSRLDINITCAGLVTAIFGFGAMVTLQTDRVIAPVNNANSSRIQNLAFQEIGVQPQTV